MNTHWEMLSTLPLCINFVGIESSRSDDEETSSERKHETSSSSSGINVVAD